MNIAFSFDDVVAWTHLLKPRIAHELYGVDISPIQFHRDFVVERKLLSLEKYAEVEFRARSGAYSPLPVARSLYYIKLLQRDGHSLKIVTDRSTEKGSFSAAEAWLGEHSLKVPIVSSMTISSRLSACVGSDVFIDEDLGNLIALRGAVRHLLFFQWSYRAENDVPLEIHPVICWREIYRYVGNVASGGRLQRKL